MSVTDLSAYRENQELRAWKNEAIRLRAEHMEMECALRVIDSAGPMTHEDAVRDNDLGSYRQALRARLVLGRIRRAREEAEAADAAPGAA